MDRNEYLHKVLDVILHINEGAVTRKGEGHPTAFFNFSGHTAMLSIQVNKNGCDGLMNDLLQNLINIFLWIIVPMRNSVIF